MKDLRGIRGAQYIASLIAQGEHEQQDFKFAIPDSRKIARSISAFANHSGGRLLVGVKDNGVIAGVRSEEEIYMIEQAAGMFCEPPQEVRITPFRCDDGLIVVRAEVSPSSVRPVSVKEADGKLKAYYRVADENIAAPALMVKGWRMAARSEGIVIPGLSDPSVKAMLEAAASPEGTTLEEAMVKACLSASRTEEIAVTLLGTGLLEMRYAGGRFKLYASEMS